MRMKRKQEIEKKMNECPTKEDDSSSKEEEEKEFGEWKLKSSNSYKVPFGRKVNLKSKLNEMICCQEHIFNTKKSFNSKLLSLEAEKNRLEQIIKSKRDRVKEIQSILDSNDPNGLRAPICDQTISVEGNNETYRLTSLLPQIKELPYIMTDSSMNLSKLEEDEMKERKILMKFEIEKLSKEIDESIANFDESVYKLKRERFHILLDTKICEMNLKTMFSELELLQQFEENDKMLRNKLNGLNMEKIEVRESYKNLLITYMKFDCN